jgi:hypothetical protein
MNGDTGSLPLVNRIANQQDAVTVAYAAGMVASKGSLFIEGVGSRTNNWGVRATLSVTGATQPAAKLAIKALLDVHNNDGRNRLGTGIVFHLTTLNEVRRFGGQLGIENQIGDALDEVYMLDELSGRRDDRRDGIVLDKATANRKTIVLAEYDTLMLDRVMTVCTPWISDDLILNAFLEGSRGLTLGYDDVVALVVCQSIVARYGRGIAA